MLKVLYKEVFEFIIYQILDNEQFQLKPFEVITCELFCNLIHKQELWYLCNNDQLIIDT
jgi:hypothetical protein